LELNTILKFIENAVMNNNSLENEIPDELPMYVLREINHRLGHAIDGIKKLIELDQ